MINRFSATFLALAATASLTLAADSLTPQQKEAAQVRKTIEKVNDNWQKNHKAEGTPFWHNAAYHTGNMEAFYLTGKEE